jgi:hypothetical protein
MRVIQSLGKQHTKTALRTNLSTMSREMANEATTGAEEEVSIFIGQTGQGIKRKAVHRHINGGRKERAFIEPNPVDVVVIGHVLLKLPNTLQRPSPLYPRISQRSITYNMKVRQRMG